jgi:CDP-paratose 2-epimerase
LIFGGAGFIGSNWAYRLLKTTDAKIHIFDNLSRRGVHQNLDWLRREANGSDRIKITIGDIRDENLVMRVVQSATEIYHFAAQVAVTTSVSDPRCDFDVNVGGTINILEAARKSGRKPFILFTSTNKVYGAMNGRQLQTNLTRYLADDPGTSESQSLDFYSPYGCSKGAADQYVHDYSRIFGLPTVVFRMSCIAGRHQFGNEDQGWIAHFLYSALQGIPLTIYGDGRQVRDVLCVDDLVRAFEAARTHMPSAAGHVFNMGGGQGNSLSLLEAMDEIKRLTGRPLAFDFEPTRPGDQLLYITDYSKFHAMTGWKPRKNIRQTLETIYDWWKEQRHAEVPLVAHDAVSLPDLADASRVAS